MKNKKGFFQYIKFDSASIQGQFNRLFMVIGVIVLVFFALYSQFFHRYNDRQQYLYTVLSPTANSTAQLAYLFTISDAPHSGAARKQLNLLLDELNQLSDAWEDKSYLPLQQQLIDQTAAVQQLSEQGKSWREDDAYAQLQKSIERFNQRLQADMNDLSSENRSFAAQLDPWLIIISVLFFLFGIFMARLVIIFMIHKIVKLRGISRDIAMGILPESVPLSNDEFLGIRKELNVLTDNLKTLTYFARAVGQGNFNTSIDAFDEHGALGTSLKEMRDSLKKVSEEQQNRRWVNEGIAQFSDILRKNNEDIDALTHELISPLVKYMGALKGAIFVQEEDPDNGQPYLSMRACYAYDRVKFMKKRFPAGNGLIGQAYLEKEQIYLTEIPANYESISTGLGEGSPKSLIMLPLMENGKIEGVLELASLKTLEPYQVQFLEKVCESMASTISAVKNNEKNKELLQEAQLVAEQLSAQEEEMRQNMEEMQATQEEMQRTQHELALKEANLYAFLNNTTDSIITITRDYKVGLINNVLKARYKGTAFEGISEGSDVLPSLGAVAEEWKGYYDRAFAGERMNFTLKSSVAGEDAWREYSINPIREKNGQVIGASVLSRDISERMRFELNMKTRSAVLKAITEHPADAYLAVDAGFRILAVSKNNEILLPAGTPRLQENDSLMASLRHDKLQEWRALLEKVFSGEEQLLPSPAHPSNTLAASCYPVEGEDGHIIAALITGSKTASNN